MGGYSSLVGWRERVEVNVDVCSHCGSGVSSDQEVCRESLSAVQVNLDRAASHCESRLRTRRPLWIASQYMVKHRPSRLPWPLGTLTR